MASDSPLVLVSGGLGWLGRRLVESVLLGLPDHEALRTPRADTRVRVLALPGQDPAPFAGLDGARYEVAGGGVRRAG